MNLYENEFFILEYSSNDKYAKFIIDALNNRTNEIANFFGIKKVDEKIKIKIYYSINEFKNFLIPYLKDHKYYDWMIGSTHDGNINNLSFECCKLIREHKDIQLEEYLDDIMHEVVHKFHHLFKGNNKTNNGWFHEALATNLSNQKFDIVPIDCTLEQLKTDFNNISNQYSISYTIGKCMFENYAHGIILFLCKNEELLEQMAPQLFEQSILYANEKLNNNMKK